MGSEAKERVSGPHPRFLCGEKGRRICVLIDVKERKKGGETTEMKHPLPTADSL